MLPIVPYQRANEIDYGIVWHTGAQDLETTVANILQRTDLYYAEQQ